MSVLLQAIRSNNRGVLHLQEHEDQQALNSLTTSLAAFQHMLVEQEEQALALHQQSCVGVGVGVGVDIGSDSNSNSNSDDSKQLLHTATSSGSLPPDEYGRTRSEDSVLPAAVVLSPCHFRCIPLSQHQQHHHHHHHQQDHHQHHQTTAVPGAFIVSNAIHFGEASAQASLEQSLSALRIYSASVIWNIALLYHLRAGKHRSDLHSKAQRMYEKVLKVIAGLEEDAILLERSHHHQGLLPVLQSTAWLLRISALNNMGHVLQELGDYPSSQQAFMLLSVFYEIAHIIVEPVLGVKALHQILINILLAGEITNPGAAAA